jgi:hypothetical protein
MSQQAFINIIRSTEELKSAICDQVQIDRNSLPRHEFAASTEYDGPADRVEQAVQAAWQAALAHIADPISVNENFFSVSCSSHAYVMSLPSALAKHCGRHSFEIVK